MENRVLDRLKRLLALGGFLGLAACVSGSADGPGLREGLFASLAAKTQLRL